MMIRSVAGGIVLVLAVGMGPGASAQSRARYERPTAEQTLAFLKSLTPVWGGGGPRKLGNRWQDKTVDDIRTMKKVKVGGHTEAGPHLLIKPDDWKYFTSFEEMVEADFQEVQGRGADTILSHLAHLPPSLTHLKVELRGVTGKGARHLGKLKNLKSLHIELSQGSDLGQALARLSTLGKLETLQLGCEEMGLSGMAMLARSKSLKTLRVTAPSLTDKVLPSFRSLGVQELDLTKPHWIKPPQYKITMGGVKKLLKDRRSLPNLKTLKLRGVPFARQLTSEAGSLRPGLRIIP